MPSPRFLTGNGRTSHPRGSASTVEDVNRSSEIREFLLSRRARITPRQAGLLAYGTNRRVTGLRREEVAMLAGVSVDYHTRLERGNLRGASESVLDALARPCTWTKRNGHTCSTRHPHCRSHRLPRELGRHPAGRAIAQNL